MGIYAQRNDCLMTPPRYILPSNHGDQSAVEESAGSQDALMPGLALPLTRHLTLSKTPNLCVLRRPHPHHA